MKIWILIVFSTSLNHMTLERQDFNTREACLAALNVVASTAKAIGDAPVTRMLKADCVEDLKTED